MGTLSSIGFFFLSVIWLISFSNASASNAENQVPIIPSPPDIVSMQNPLSSSGYNSTPTVRASGTSFGDIVILYTGFNCRTEVGVAVATGPFVDVTVARPLAVGDYSFFTQIDRLGVTSACSSTFAEYSLGKVDPPSLLGYGDRELHNASPTLEVGGVASGDVVGFFTDANCSVGLGSVTASGTSLEHVIKPALPLGTYSFYAQTIRGGAHSQCALILANYEVTVTVPDAPNGIAMANPAAASGEDTTPTVLLEGVAIGDSVALFTDSNCQTSVDISGETRKGDNLEVSIGPWSPLAPGSYTFYAKASRNGVLSECSSASASYEVLESSGPRPPSALAMSNPAAASGINAIPMVRIEGVDAGDLVLLFASASCGEMEDAIGLGFSEGSSVDALVFPPLDVGSYTFYARKINMQGEGSECSTASVDYQVESSPLQTPDVPSGLSMQVPMANIGINTTPTVRVSGVGSGEAAILYTDSDCLHFAGFGMSNGSDADVVLESALELGSYSFYARAARPLGSDMQAGVSVSACSSASVDYELVESLPGPVVEVETELAPPSALSMHDPQSASGTNTTPFIRVEGVGPGDVILLFPSDSCGELEDAIGLGLAESTTVDVQVVVPLAVGNHSIYARRGNEEGVTSVCSSASVDYEVVEAGSVSEPVASGPTPPSGLSMISPAAASGVNAIPMVRVEGVDAGDLVLLFGSANCGEMEEAIGLGFSEGATVDALVFPPLDVGSYTFYARTVKMQGESSECSTASVNYEVLSDPLQTLDAPSGISMQLPSANIGLSATPTIRVSGIGSGDGAIVYMDSNCRRFAGFGMSNGSEADVTLESPLELGSYTFYARAVRPLGSDIQAGGIASACSSVSADYEVVETLPAPEPVVSTITPPSALSMHDPQSASGTNTTPFIRVEGVGPGDVILLFPSDSCGELEDAIGLGLAEGTTADVQVVVPLAVGNHSIYARRGNEEGVTSACSSASVDYEVVESLPGPVVEVETELSPPSALSMQNPAANSSAIGTPVIRVEGVEFGDMIVLFTDANCGSDDITAEMVSQVFFSDGADLIDGMVGLGFAADTVADTFVVLPLPPGNYTFYARRINDEKKVSGCSTASVNYEVLNDPLLTPPVPSSLVLQTPGSGVSTNKTPVIRANVVSGDGVILYLDSQCTKLAPAIAENFFSATEMDITLELELGRYTFYGRGVRIIGSADEEKYTISACSSVSVDYEVVETLPAPAPVPEPDPVASGPTPPSALSMSNPTNASGVNAVPAIRVEGVSTGDMVLLFDSPNCGTFNEAIGLGFAEGATADAVVFPPLDVGSYTFYASRMSGDGENSDCSSASVNYEVVNDPAQTPDVPKNLSMQEPKEGLGVNTTPTIRVGGVPKGDGAILYTDAGCTEFVGMGMSKGRRASVTLESPLSLGSYTFYARAVRPLEENAMEEGGSMSVSACSSASVDYEVVESLPGPVVEVETELAPPSALSMHDPQSASGTNTTPFIRVEGVGPGDVILLFPSDSCGELEEAIGLGLAEGTTADVQVVVPLAVGNHSIYARRGNEEGVTSVCSSASVDYEVVETLPAPAPVVEVETELAPPSALSMHDPQSASGTNTTPFIRVEGVGPGDVILLFPSDSCGELEEAIGLGLAEGTTADVQVVVPLAVGNHSIYARRGNEEGVTSVCSSASVDYEVVETLPAPAPVVEVETELAPPSALSMQNPTANSSAIGTPVIRVEGVEFGDMVALFTDANCGSDDITVEMVSQVFFSDGANLIDGMVGLGFAADTVADTFVVLPLPPGNYTFYARRINGEEKISGCSTASVNYEVLNDPLLTPPVPSSLVLQTPDSGVSTNKTPVIRANVVSGDGVILYLDSQCTELAPATVENVFSATEMDITLELELGKYTFYARGIRIIGSADEEKYTISACSSVSVDYEVVETLPVPAPVPEPEPVASGPTPPSALSMISPAAASGVNAIPMVRVEGVDAGDLVLIFSSASCGEIEEAIGIGFSEGATVDALIFPPLDVGNYTFYARTVKMQGESSECSTASVNYEVVSDPLQTLDAPNGISMQLPSANIGLSATPTIRVSGIGGGDSAIVYMDSDCRRFAGFGMSNGSEADVTLESPLELGSYTFYARAVRPLGSDMQAGGIASACSSVSADYEVVETLPAPAPAPIPEPEPVAASVLTALSMQDPQASSGTNATPTIRVEGSSPGDFVLLFDGPGCGTVEESVGMGLADDTTVDARVLLPLPVGEHTFYAGVMDQETGAISDCSTASVDYEILADANYAPPSALSIDGVSASSGANAIPVVYVEGVSTGDMVLIFDSPSCGALNEAIGFGFAEDVTVDALVFPPLDVGDYTFYARRMNHQGESSACSSVSVSYEVIDDPNLTPDAPSALSMVSPAASAGVDNTPTIRVEGIASGDGAILYTDANCRQFVGFGVSDGTVTDVSVIESPLEPGPYTFYARAVHSLDETWKQEGGRFAVSECSSVSIDYEVLES